MMNLKFEEIDGKRCVKLQGRYYTFLNEARGVREKFWLVRTGVKRVNYDEPSDASDILFKFNRNNVSCEDWGEIIASLVAEHTRVPCVKYYSASLKDEKGKDMGSGVACGSYKRNAKETEISGFNLQSLYKNLKYDNYHGESIKGLNTVEGFVDAIKGVFGKKISKEEIEDIRNDLLKQAIFDYVLAQTDRHWLNTTFLAYEDAKGKTHVRKAECYDNGCISMFKRKGSALEGMSREIGAKGKDSPYLHDRLASYCPMMGIKTSLVTIDSNVRKGSLEKIKMVDPKNDKNVFVYELALAIVNNPEIAPFYKRMESMVRSGKLMDKVKEDLRAAGDKPPAYITKMVGDVMGHQVDQLNMEIRKIIDKINSSDKEM